MNFRHNSHKREDSQHSVVTRFLLISTFLFVEIKKDLSTASESNQHHYEAYLNTHSLSEYRSDGQICVFSQPQLTYCSIKNT
jgi:hypothetical protein